MDLGFFDLAPQFFFGFAEAPLKPSEQFIFLAFGEGEIVVRKLGVFLFQLAFDFVPVSFEGKFVHR